jgi:hypothetical protein
MLTYSVLVGVGHPVIEPSVAGGTLVDILMRRQVIDFIDLKR